MRRFSAIRKNLEDCFTTWQSIGSLLPTGNLCQEDYGKEEKVSDGEIELLTMKNINTFYF